MKGSGRGGSPHRRYKALLLLHRRRGIEWHGSIHRPRPSDTEACAALRTAAAITSPAPALYPKDTIAAGGDLPANRKPSLDRARRAKPFFFAFADHAGPEC